MIRLQLKPSILKSLNFNKDNESLEIVFKKEIKTANHIEIPLKIIEDYIKSLKLNDFTEDEDNNLEHLKIVYSNFQTS